jgi:uncharacterized protein
MAANRPQLAPDPPIIQACSAGGFTISGLRHTGSVLVFADRVLPWPVQSFDGIDPSRLEAVRTTRPVPDILVVGTGAAFFPVADELRHAVRLWGPVVEAMTTPAACRTYNVLIAEGRRVAAALVALPG